MPVNNYRAPAGRMFTTGDGLSRKRVAVLGHAVPDMVEANGAAMIGQQILVRGVPFEIVGVLAEKGSTNSWNNPDEQILIPIHTAQYRIFGSDRVNSITVQVVHPDSMTVAMIEIEGILRREHGIAPGRDNDFQIRNRAEFLSTFEEATKTFTFLLGAIAAVSLLVGGIGIMNIMLVSVSERTREIGVRKAMGATRRNILLQFLIEALVLCLMGGVVGILVGSGGAVALSRLGALEHVRLAPGGHRRGAVQRRRRHLLRDVAGPSGVAARSDRGAAVRVTRENAIMWLNQTLLASALLAALMISPAWGQETQEEKTVDTSGVWELTIQTPRGAMTRTLTLEQDGTSLEGTLDTRMGSVPITEGSVEGNRISFTVAMSGRGGRTFEMSYRGSVDGDTARGTFRTPRGDEVEWTGKRIKRRS